MVEMAPAFGRLLLRGNAAVMAAAGPTCGVEMPVTACRAHSVSPRHALWLGPDEFLLLLPEPDKDAAIADLTTALAAYPHALIDISHRQIGLIVAGPASEKLLNAGCALDLDIAVFPIGACTRTLVGKAEIVLWRTDAMTFHVEVGRSFTPYVQALLREASCDVP